jgi:zinc transporter, ZIP family
MNVRQAAARLGLPGLSTASALRKLAGALIAVLGLALMAADGAQVLRSLFGGPAAFPQQFASIMQAGLPGLASVPVWSALAAGLMAAVATALGTLPVLLFARISQRVCDALLGFGAGVMLAATSFSLLLPALEAQQAAGAGPWQAASTAGLGLAFGALALLGVSMWMQQRRSTVAPEHALEHAAQTRLMQRSWLFAGAIALHNVPEGLAIGVAYANPDYVHAQVLATGIALQDVPEGLVIALALRSAGISRGVSLAAGAASGLAEPLAAVVGAVAMGLAAGLLPWGLSLAAGAMLYAICHEAIPGAHAHGNANTATVGLIFGFVLMMLLDIALA